MRGAVMRGLRLGVLLASAGLIAGGFMARVAANAAPDKSQPAHAAFDVTACQACHDEPMKGMRGTHHTGVEGSCAACHGDPTEHLKSNLEKGEPGPIVSLKKMKPEEANETCLTCHDKGHQANFAGSAHDRRKVACTSCHSVHQFKSPKGQLKTARDSETCYTCHHADPRQDRCAPRTIPSARDRWAARAATTRTTARRPKMIKADWVTETCLTCHTEKRGPFLWEHAPVRENCAICHDPHGSNHDKLLVAKQPYPLPALPSEHAAPRHALRRRATRWLAPRERQLSNRSVEHACRNCHQNVHGGNAPSGPYLGR